MSAALPEPLRVLHLTPRLTRAAGGAWHYVEGLTRNLERCGVQCTVAGVVDAGSDDWRTLQVTRIITGGPAILPANYGYSPTLRGALRCEAHDVQLVHLHGHRAGTDAYGVSVARELGVPLILSPHGQLHGSIGGMRSLKGRLYHRLVGERVLHHVNCGLAVSDAEVEPMRAALPGRPIASLPIGIDVDSYRVGKSGIAAQLAPASAGRRVLLYLAYMHANKGLGRLTDAWLAMHRERPDWHLILAGIDVAGLGAAAAERMRAAGAGASFTLLGPVFGDQQRALLADADLFTMPSDSESFGIAFAESLASGVPVIATRGAPWASVVEHRCGWWIEPTPEALMATLRESTALSDADRRAMGERGRTLVRQRFDWMPIAMQTRQLYEWLLGRGERPAFVISA